ncbi:DUF3558 domain-containing protein [Streptomyces abyssomicinicus]|uniref:DUF3558 domain-containing protein n=1 Tax=Streptomyces abyssomicinicus TaxID=574929 RepID=UPI0012509F7F|nr:DUF3558 domain-containing protein [Streptomyces abyssomicinicus]
MPRKAYTIGTAALLAAVLAGCSGGPSEGGQANDSKPGAADATTAEAEPGRYRTLPEPCGAVGEGTLERMLPGLKQITDARKREAAYEGTSDLSYDLDRQVGCHWQAGSRDATDSLSLDFERVVSYEPEVGDDAKAGEIFTDLREEAGVPAPGAGSSTTPDDAASPSASASGADATADGKGGTAGADGAAGEDTGPASGSPEGSAGTDGTADLGPRSLEELGDEAFLDDSLGAAGTTASERTVTVVFRTSNVIVKIVYTSRPTLAGETTDGEEMQDRARELAAALAEELVG